MSYNLKLVQYFDVEVEFKCGAKYCGEVRTDTDGDGGIMVTIQQTHKEFLDEESSHKYGCSWDDLNKSASEGYDEKYEALCQELNRANKHIEKQEQSILYWSQKAKETE